MSTTTDLRAQRAVQLVAGVLLGIGVGAGVAALLGTGPAALGVAVFVALCATLTGRAADARPDAGAGDRQS